MLVQLEYAIRYCAFAIIMALGQIVFFIIGGIINSLVGYCMGYTITGIHFWNHMFTWKHRKLVHYRWPGEIGLRMRMHNQNSDAKKQSKVKVITSISMTLIVGIYGIALLVNQWDSLYVKVYFGLCCVFLIMQWESTADWIYMQCRKGFYKEIWEEHVIFSEKVKAGISPAQVEIKEIDLKEYEGKKLTNVFQYYLMQQYYHYLDAERFDKVKEYIEFLEQYIERESCTGLEEIWYLCEILYFYSEIEPNQGMAECYRSFLAETFDTECNFYIHRVRAAYHNIMGEKKEDVLMKIEEGLNIVTKYDYDGMENLEKKLLLKLKEKVQNKEDKSQSMSNEVE